MAVDLIIQKCTCNAHAVFFPIILVSKIGKIFFYSHPNKFNGDFLNKNFTNFEMKVNIGFICTLFKLTE
jgi:hypothetical protein